MRWLLVWRESVGKFPRKSKRGGPAAARGNRNEAAIADRWGLLAARAKKKGQTLSAIDGLLAATAIHHNLTIVSRNENDFGGMQVQVLNPWKV